MGADVRQEASGIADPYRIANVAHAEPDLQYSGIVTVVDGLQFDSLARDPLIAPQFKHQIACAQIIAVRKLNLDEGLRKNLAALNSEASITTSDQLGVEQLLLTGRDPAEVTQTKHPAYAKWSYTGPQSFEQAELSQLLKSRPEALYRLKGHVRGRSGIGYLVQIVGSDSAISEIAQPRQTELIGIGLAARLTSETCNTWWSKALAHAGQCTN